MLMGLLGTTPRLKNLLICCESMAEDAPVVSARHLGGSYKVPGRELFIKLRITNRATSR